MNISFYIEFMLLLFAVLASNLFLYSLTFFNLNKKKPKIFIIKGSKKDVLAFTSLIASNPLRLTSSESSGSDNLSVTSSESDVSDVSENLSETSSDTCVSDNLSVSSSDTYVSQNIFDNIDIIEIVERNDRVMNPTQNSNFILDQTSTLDSLTILSNQDLDYLRETVMILHSLPVNTPAGILQQVKFEELVVLYSQDLIHFGITHTELRLIIELFPSFTLFNPEINHLILTIMSYYHL